MKKWLVTGALSSLLLTPFLIFASGFIGVHAGIRGNPDHGCRIGGAAAFAAALPAFDQEVADEAARLSLTGISVGWKVKQTDNSTIYVYNGPSSAVGGMFVSGTTDGAGNGIFTVRGTEEGKPYYNLIGVADNTANDFIKWMTPDAGAGNPGWRINTAGGGSAYSEDDVATPDLATTWVNDTPTITPITQGELDAGATVAGAGTAAANGVASNGSGGSIQAGRYAYTPVLITDPTVSFTDPGHGDPTVWAINENKYTSASSAAFPWGLTYVEGTGDSPAPTVTRNDIAATANWTVVP